MSAPLPLARLRTALSDRDLAILRTVSDFRFVNGRQLQVLHFDGQHQTPDAAARGCRRVLARLAELRVLHRLERPIGGVRAGSEGSVFCLGPAGRRLLAAGPRQGFREPSLAFRDHCLAIVDVLVAVAAAAQRNELQLINYEAEPTCWRQLPGYAGDTLRPDLLLVIGRDDLELHWWIEVDRATEHRPAIERKLQQFIDYCQSGTEQAQSGVFPRVAFLTTTTSRAAALTHIIERFDSPLPLFTVGLLARSLETLVPAGGAP